MERKVIADERFEQWENCRIKLVQKDSEEFIVEVVHFSGTGVSTREYLRLLTCYGPPSINFLAESIWLDDAKAILDFVKRFFPVNA